MSPPPPPSSPSGPWPGAPPEWSVPTGPPTVGPPWAGPPAPAAWSPGPPGPPLWGARPAAVPPPPPRTGRAAWQVGLGLLAVLLIVAVGVVALRDTGTTDVALGGEESPAAGDGPIVPDSRAVPPSSTTQPSTTTTAPPARLGPVPIPPAEPGAHAFLAREDDGDPIAWDPCETIEYVVNSRTAPPGGAEILAAALAKVSAATGLVFEDQGATDEVPTLETRPQTDPARYGEGWSPVLIAWTDPAEVADLAGAVGGVGTPDWTAVGGGEYESVTGIVHLDGPDVADWIAHGEDIDVAHLVLHELGHLVGLDHVDDVSQVMYHNRDGRGEVDAAWNDGDLAGLATLGAGDCNPDI